MENCFSTSRATSKVACFGEGVHWQWPQPSQLAMSGHVRFDLFGDMLDALVQTPPVTAEVLNDSDLRGDKDVDALGQNFWELMAQKAKPLADRNAVLSGRCTDSAIAYASRKSFW